MDASQIHFHWATIGTPITPTVTRMVLVLYLFIIRQSIPAPTPHASCRREIFWSVIFLVIPSTCHSARYPMDPQSVFFYRPWQHSIDHMNTVLHPHVRYHLIASELQVHLSCFFYVNGTKPRMDFSFTAGTVLTIVSRGCWRETEGGRGFSS